MKNCYRYTGEESARPKGLEQRGVYRRINDDGLLVSSRIELALPGNGSVFVWSGDVIPWKPWIWDSLWIVQDPEHFKEEYASPFLITGVYPPGSPMGRPDAYTLNIEEQGGNHRFTLVFNELSAYDPINPSHSTPSYVGIPISPQELVSWEVWDEL